MEMLNFTRTSTALNQKMSYTLICALIIRILLIFSGSIIDAYSDIKYTDVDYNVYTDAARLVWEGQSPFHRDTYRYPPLLAFLLIPNIYFASFGKILFAVADIGILWHYFSIHELKPNPTMRGVWIALVWALNISFAVISTRGSSDSIHNFMILSVLKLTFMKNYIPAGLLLGLSIHLRLYPIIFVPAIILHILRPDKKRKMSWSSQTFERNGVSSLTNVPAKIQVFHIFPTFIATHLEPHFRTIEYTRCRVYDAARFIMSTFAAFALSTTSAFLLYGWEYMENALLYHLKRMDSRHNFSPHFFWLYLTDMSGAARSSKTMLSAPTILSTMTFLPQVILLALVILCLARKDLSACFLLLTYVLVAFNKVID